MRRLPIHLLRHKLSLVQNRHLCSPTKAHQSPRLALTLKISCPSLSTGNAKFTMVLVLAPANGLGVFSKPSVILGSLGTALLQSNRFSSTADERQPPSARAGDTHLAATQLSPKGPPRFREAIACSSYRKERNPDMHHIGRKPHPRTNPG